MPRWKIPVQPSRTSGKPLLKLLEQLTSIGVHFVVTPVLVVMGHGPIARAAFVLFRMGEANTLGHPGRAGSTNRGRATAAMAVLR